jgi:hypothetical protein
MQPQQFCQTSTTTGPVEHPGRQYDLTLPINPGFAVQSLQVDATTHAAGITWEVDDPDGEAFRTELTTFIEGRLPAPAVVTITNPNAGVAQVCQTAAAMQIHIECLRLDQTPPDLIELVYNAGQDLVQNPAYNESPPLNPPVSQGNYGFRLLSRQDDPGPFPGFPPANDALCTSVAGRGWETNDRGRTFEIWGRDITLGSNVTPTPRGTPVQEITSDGPPVSGGRPSTIWQTFTAPSSGNFIIRVVHGARDPGETHRITLDNGDTDDAQNGDLIDDTMPNVPSVTSNGGPNPWTVFNQTIPLNGGSTYTLALSTSDPGVDARGGLFTDMRAYLDVPGERATAATDDETCVVTTEETSTNSICTFWQPTCTAGEITEWQRVDNGLTLTNTEFWAQVPTPSCCQPEVQAAEGGGGSANLSVSDVVCATVGGILQSAIRQVVLDPSGGQLSQQFISTDGAAITPDSWTPGACAAQIYLNDEILCDVDPGTGATTAFLRKYVQTWSTAAGAQTTQVRDFNLAGTATYTPTGSVRDCSQAVPGAEREVLCDTDTTSGVTTPFLRLYVTRNGAQTGIVDTLLDGSAYTPTGTIGSCDQAADPIAVTGLCLADGTPIAVLTRRDSVTGTVTQDGWINLTSGAFTVGTPPVGTVACGESRSIQVTGVFCDLNGSGDVLALVLIEYSYNPDGTIASVRLVNATTGVTYVPAGTISVCPSGTDTGPEQDLVILCDDSGPFIADYRRDQLGAVVAVSYYNLDTSAHVTTGLVRTCATGINAEVLQLCDVVAGTPVPFLRRQVFTDGLLTSTVDTTPSGAPYVVAGTVATCTELDAETVTLCDAGNNYRPYIRRITYNATTGAQVGSGTVNVDGSAYTVIGPETVCDGRDSDSTILCDAAGTRFIRTYNKDTAGNITGFTDRTLAGAAFTPSGAVSVCATTVATDLDFAEEILCSTSGGVVTPFIRRFTFNSSTGAVTATTNLTLAGAAFTPAAVGLCSDCCGTVLGSGCTNTGSGFYTAIRAENGTVSLVDSVSGATITAANIVPCPSDDAVQTLQARVFDVIPGTPWTTAQITGTITSLTATGVAGTWSITPPEGPAVTALPTGYTATFEAEDDNTLDPPTSIAADAASRAIVVWTERP